MKKLFAFITILGILNFGVFNMNVAIGQNEDTTEASADSSINTEVNNEAFDEAEVEDEINSAFTPSDSDNSQSIHQVIKDKFIEGGAGFMGIILVSFIFGLALAIERIIYLNLATTNTDKLIKRVEDALNTGGIEAAKEVCRNTPGPVASIFYQGLDRSDSDIEIVEKSVVAYGGVQMGLLEKGLTWIALFIALAPMLGFLGTVVGMIEAFDAIEREGDVTPTLVAGGIKVALITTVGGLIVAMILQVFYNYILSKIDSIVNSMEDASISLIDIITKYKLKN